VYRAAGGMYLDFSSDSYIDGFAKYHVDFGFFPYP
jgi:hypothetical protein